MERGWVPTLALMLPLLLQPEVAEACGGTFCDGPTPTNPTPMPVDQTGEDILFVQDGDTLEVHVRIQYQGDAERFAWMVPLPALPEISVGVDGLFSELSAATLPVWQTNLTYEDPADIPPSPPSPTTGGGVFVPDESPEPEPPVVVYEELVGNFEIVVLDGGSASQVLEFFMDNNYAFGDDAEPLIQEYIDEGFLITGVKLVAGASADTIQPLVFRFASNEPCIPLRLTAVAARDDMAIRAYFLGEERWAPTNYKHVVLNSMAFDWVNLDFGTYVETLSAAIDEAGGQAFVTEFAAASSRVQKFDFWRSDYTTEGMAELSEWELLDALDDMEMLPFPSGPTPQLHSVMHDYLPAPEGWPHDERWFWYQLLWNPNLLDPGADIDMGEGVPQAPEEPLGPLEWDVAGFAAALEELVIAPARHASQLLDEHPMLTRLTATMSAHEMTLDPTFHRALELPDVLEQRTTEAFIYTDETWAQYEVPLAISTAQDELAILDEAQLCVADNGEWPWGSPSIEAMPRALRIEEIPANGPPQIMVDNSEAIHEAMSAHNYGSPCATEGWVPPESEGEGGGESGDPSVDGDVGCGCQTQSEGRGLLGLAFGLLGLAGFGFVRRKR